MTQPPRHPYIGCSWKMVLYDISGGSKTSEGAHCHCVVWQPKWYNGKNIDFVLGSDSALTEYQQYDLSQAAQL